MKRPWYDRPTFKAFLTFLKILGGVVICWLFGGLPFPVIGSLAIVGSMFFLLINGWALYAFLRYREGRQDELYQVLAAAVDRQMPLAQAVRSYMEDRPRPVWPRALRRLKDVAMFFVYLFFLPLYCYCRIWIGWWRFDRLVERLAYNLEEGDSLTAALQDVPGAAAHEVRLAVEVGEATGALGPCLKGASRERWSAAWLEVAPRFAYPLVLLLFVVAITTFLMLMIAPRIKRIFNEFGEPLPVMTADLFRLGAYMVEYVNLMGFAVFLATVVLSVLVASSSWRWRMPVIGRLYRWGAQGEVLRTLGRLLDANQTAPQALGFLAGACGLAPAVSKRVDWAALAVKQGQPLEDALAGAQLLPASMTGLVRSSAKLGTLPWALMELGDQLAAKAFRVVRRTSLVVGPLLVVIVGALVGFVALGMFMPLIYLFARLSE